MKIKIITALLLCSIISIRSSSEIPQCTIIINRDTIIKYRTNIDSFIDIKRDERNQLLSLPDGNSFFGKATNFLIENFIAPIFSKYGNVNVEEAKIFLSRSFERESLLKKAIYTMQDNPDTIAYLNDIFSQAHGDILSRKDSIRFLEIVKKTKYKKVPNPKCMGTKNERGEYTLCDTDFYDFSAATFMAFHIFENHVTLTQNVKRHRKTHTNQA